MKRGMCMDEAARGEVDREMLLRGAGGGQYDVARQRSDTSGSQRDGIAWRDQPFPSRNCASHSPSGG